MKVFHFLTPLLICSVLPLTLQLLPRQDEQKSSDRLTNDLELLDNSNGDNNVKEICVNKVNSAAERWLDTINDEMRDLKHASAVAQWNYETNLTDLNAQKSEAESARFANWFVERLPAARRFLRQSDDICNMTTQRLLNIFVNYNLPPLADSQQTRRRINSLVNEMTKIYGTAVVTDSQGRQYRMEPELTQLFATSRDYNLLAWAWQAWRNVTGRRMKPLYVELVEKMNEAARDNGFADVGVSWQTTDFQQTDIEEMMVRLYGEIKPFYEQLHAYVRRKLIEVYPHESIDPTGPIPAHLLGNMWAQEWTNIVDLVLPYPNANDVDIKAALERANSTPAEMFRTAESFFQSIGLEPMTDEFWSNSAIVRPTDGRPFSCHGAAYDMFTQTDFRIKMCTEVTRRDFQTVHHEMGHIQYYMQYRHQSTLFRDGANAAFHEAIGDTIALSVLSPGHLTAIGLVDRSATVRTYEQEINALMEMALEKIAFLPFGFIVDKWRYEVFRGVVSVDNFNNEWWRLRQLYQGVKPSVARSDDDFDPGCKFHIPNNVPYSRYFLSFIGQFQFHRALCQAKGHRGPLHTCDIYRSRSAGRKLKSVLSLGASRPWPEAMQLFTGQREFKTDAVLEYFRPLMDWLEKENKGHHVGW